jgi:hypothetical protein
MQKECNHFFKLLTFICKNLQIVQIELDIQILNSPILIVFLTTFFICHFQSLSFDGMAEPI